MGAKGNQTETGGEEGRGGEDKGTRGKAYGLCIRLKEYIS